ncbi:MAG: hypothetical protein ABW192_04910 [Sphingobium sp.]
MAHAIQKIQPPSAQPLSAHLDDSPPVVEDEFLDLTADDMLDPEPGSSMVEGSAGMPNASDEAAASHDCVVRAVGTLVCSWGSLERTTMDKLTAMRLAAGDVRLVGGRMRPGMARLLAELRALVSMRDRHDKQGLVVIADLENHIQRIAQFHLLVISGFQASEADTLLCRDSKNSERRISLGDVEREIAMIETIKERLSAI